MRFLILTTLFCCYVVHVNVMDLNVSPEWPPDGWIEQSPEWTLWVSDERGPAAVKDGKGNWTVFASDGSIMAWISAKGEIAHGPAWKSQADFDHRVFEIHRKLLDYSHSKDRMPL